MSKLSKTKRELLTSIKNGLRVQRAGFLRPFVKLNELGNVIGYADRYGLALLSDGLVSLVIHDCDEFPECLYITEQGRAALEGK